MHEKPQNSGGYRRIFLWITRKDIYAEGYAGEGVYLTRWALLNLGRFGALML